MVCVKLPTPIGLLQEKGVIGEILSQLPRRVLDETEQQNDPWSWLAAWVKKNPVEHRRIGTVGTYDAEIAALKKKGFKLTGDSFRKTFEAAASQRKAFNVLTQVARGGGSVSNHDWHLKILAAEKRGDRKAAERLTKKHLASILQTVRGRRWLLENKEKGLSAPPEMCAWARQKYQGFYDADVRRLGRGKADKKWKGTETPQFKLDSYGDKIVEAMTTGWLAVGHNGFPGLCFMSDELLARLLGHTLPLPSLLSDRGLKLIVTTRQRIGLKKAEILFTGMEKIGGGWWVLLDMHGSKTSYRIRPLPPVL